MYRSLANTTSNVRQSDIQITHDLKKEEKNTDSDHYALTIGYKSIVVLFLCFISVFSLVEKHNDNLVDMEAESIVATQTFTLSKTESFRIPREK